MDRYEGDSENRALVVDSRLAAKPPDGQFGERLGHGLLRSMALKAAAPIQGPDVQSGSFPDSMLPDVPPVVPDTNILRADLIYACRNSVRTVLVNAANAQFLRLYCAQHVVDEISEHSLEWACREGVSHDDFMRRWEHEYLPLIRVVPVIAADKRLLTPAESKRIAVLEDEDKDDVPSAILALLLGAYYLSKDKAALKAVYGDAADLVKHDKWLEILKAGGNAGELGMMLNASLTVVGLAGYGVFAGIRRLPPVVAILGLAALGGVGVFAYRHSGQDTRQSLKAGLGRVAVGVAELFAAYQWYLTEFRNAAPPTPAWEELAVANGDKATLTRACLYTLCRSRTSHRSAVELSSALPTFGAGHGQAKVRAALRASVLVSETWRGRWQVGRASNRPLARQLNPGTADLPVV